MDSTKFTFRGLMAPVFTPFDGNGNVNLPLIPEYAKYLHTNGINGILVNGTTGEGVSMTTDERKSVLHAWVEACKPYGQTIMAQVGGTNMSDVKNLARHAEELNVSSILCLADLFFRPKTIDELVRYLKIVSRAAPNTPLLYYHIPSFTGINLNMETLLSNGADEIPTFAGIKFTDTDLVVGGCCVGSPCKELAVFLGADTLLLPALLLGFNSAIGTTINMFPDHNKKIIEYFKSGAIDEAAAEQRQLNHKITQITELGSWVSSMKGAMRKLTPIDVGPVRDPLVNLCPEKIVLNPLTED